MDRLLGVDKTDIIAEISCNHDGQFDRAVELILCAYRAGADAVKVQMFRPDDMTLNSDKPPFLIHWRGKTIKLYDLYKEAQTPYEWISDLVSLAHSLGLKIFATLYHPRTVMIAEEFGFDGYKVASQEIGYTDLLREINDTGKPILISTGGAEYKEIWAATRYIYQRDYYVLHCVSAYPASFDQMNLRTIYELSRLYSGRVGLSDHSEGWLIPSLAATLEIAVIEKHLCLDHSCLDGEFSLLPDEFKLMVDSVRNAESAMGKIAFGGTCAAKRKDYEGNYIRTIA